MKNDELTRRLYEIRMREMENREVLLEQLREVRDREAWKELGFKSLRHFCEEFLGCEPDEARDLLVGVGEILISRDMVDENPKTQERIDKLKAWRKKTASRAGVAAFRILTNRTLMAIAKDHPRTLRELERIHGVGPKKIEYFGKRVLATIS